MKALLDLFARHRSRDTGVWSLGQDPQRTIFLERGLIVFAQSTHPLDKLTSLLVERGKITQAQLDYTLQNLKPGVSIGRNLIEMGFITQRDLLEVAKAQVERITWGAMGNMDEEPRFQAKELDASVVRLGLDTPFTLLVGCLHLRDRERLLDQLGPLEQKLQIAGRLELNLPPDLAKVPALLDGQRRLLDLAQEAGVEPLRLGAFALFLREMGLAKLTFGPGSETHEPEEPRIQMPISAAPAMAPTALAEPESPLLASIEAAQRPTVDLNHLAGALDAIDDAEPLDLSSELPIEPKTTRDLDFRVQVETSGSVDMPKELLEVQPSKGHLGIWVLLLILAAGGGYAGWRVTRKNSAPSAVQPEPPLKQESEVLAPTTAPRDIPAPQAKPTPAPVVPVASKSDDQEPQASARWETLKKGDWDTALAQGHAHRLALKDAWVLRLEVACQPETLTHAIAAFPAQADLFLVPMSMKDGRTCRQVCFGDFKTEAEAQTAIDQLPTLFREGGNKPHPFQATQLPEKQ